MAIIDSTGAKASSLTDYMNEINTLFIDTFGINFSTDPQTPQGQLIGLLALTLSQVDSSIVNAFNATDIYTANGQQLDYLCSNLNIIRKQAIYSQVDCTFTGVINTTIPAGTIVADNQNNKFTTIEDVNIGIDNKVTTTVESTSTALFIEPNTITKIVNLIDGLETVNNAQIGTVGQTVEADDKYLNRFLKSVFLNSSSSNNAIKAELLKIATVKDALVISNDTKTQKTIKNIVIEPNSICSVVLGGDKQNIINAIATKKPSGIATTGDINGEIIQDYQNNISVNYYEATAVEIFINININIKNNFSYDGVEAIKTAIINYFNGVVDAPSNTFNHNGFSIADDVIYSRLYTPINTVPGHEIRSLTIGTSRDQTSTNDITIDLNQYAVITAENIKVELV